MNANCSLLLLLIVSTPVVLAREKCPASEGTCPAVEEMEDVTQEVSLLQTSMKFRAVKNEGQQKTSSKKPAGDSDLSTARLWDQAVREANMNKKDISDFGRQVVKFPKSLVERLLSETKSTMRKHKYNMVGRIKGDFGSGEIEQQRRQWAVDFAKANFTGQDIFVCTGYSGEWKTLGECDKTKELGDRDQHQYEPCQGCHDNLLDLTYWRILMSSEFTLCPGGDTSWSMRAYEAALAGSICLIKSYESDWRPSSALWGNRTSLQKVFDLFKYVLVSGPQVYNQSVADDNLQIFIRYLTFIEGDNTPP